MITIKCDMPRTVKSNCNTKTKIDHGGIQNRYARFGLDVRRLIHYTTQLSAKWTLSVWGPFKCYVTLFFCKLDPHPPPRNANNIEHYIFVTLFSGKSDTPHPHLRYVTLEWSLGVNILGPTLGLLRNQRTSHYFTEVLCANSNLLRNLNKK